MSGEGLAAAPLVDSKLGLHQGLHERFSRRGRMDIRETLGEREGTTERHVHTDESVRECSQLQVDREHSLSGESETPTAHR
jgi:hypothetical protein